MLCASNGPAHQGITCKKVWMINNLIKNFFLLILLDYSVSVTYNAVDHSSCQTDNWVSITGVGFQSGSRINFQLVLVQILKRKLCSASQPIFAKILLGWFDTWVNEDL